MPERAVSEVRASASSITSGSDFPSEKVELAVKLLEVSSRVLVYRSSSILIFFFIFTGSAGMGGWPVPG